MTRFLFVIVIFAAPGFALSQPTVQDPLSGAAARIKRIRKADATVVVLNSFGEPVPGATVRVEQVRHAFLFGSGAIPLLTRKNAQEGQYERQFAALFNFATVVSYWHQMEPEQGSVSY